MARPDISTLENRQQGGPETDSSSQSCSALTAAGGSQGGHVTIKG